MTLEEFFSLERSRQEFLLTDFAEHNYSRGYSDGWVESSDVYFDKVPDGGFISFEDWLKTIEM